MKVQARRVADLYVLGVSGMPSPLTAEKERALNMGDTFQECWSCPVMVVIPAGSFMMGSPEGDGDDDKRPQRKVTIAKAFAVGRLEVSFDEWDGCVAHGGCLGEGRAGANFGRGRQPVINVSWDDTQAYVKWLSKQTGKTYRLLTEAEWEYAARAGTTTHYSFGNDIWTAYEHAWWGGNSGSRTNPVGERRANGFGLHDMHGNVWEWVEGCDDINSSPFAPGDSWQGMIDDCSARVLRGGSWKLILSSVRSTTRTGSFADHRLNDLGFRVARDMASAVLR